MDVTGSTQLIRGQDEQKLYDELRSAIWVVKVETEHYIGTGTGFCIDKDGLIMTCAHCVPGNSCRVARQKDENYQKAVVLYKADRWDIAILCLEKVLKQKDNASNDYPFVPLAKDGTLTRGQDVYAVSHQDNLMYSFSSGKISYPCKDEVKSFGKRSSRSSEEKHARCVPSITSDYRTQREISVSGNFDGDLPMIEIRNIHLSQGGSGCPIFLHTGEAVGLLSSGTLSRSYAVHVSALRIAFDEAKNKYNELVARVAAKRDELSKQKSADVTKSDDN